MAQQYPERSFAEEMCVGCTPHHWAIAARALLCIVTGGISELIRGEAGWCNCFFSPTGAPTSTTDQILRMREERPPGGGEIDPYSGHGPQTPIQPMMSPFEQPATQAPPYYGPQTKTPIPQGASPVPEMG